MKRFIFLFFSLPMLVIAADEKPPEFADVLPFLKQNCLACHNSQKAKADLNLETPKLMLKGGETGPAIVPGDADASFLYTTAAHIEEPTMPPKKNDSKARKLNEAELALLKKWIDGGAKGEASSHLAPPEEWTNLNNGQPILQVVASSDGRYVAASRGQQVSVYDLALGKKVTQLRDRSLPGDAKSHLDVVQSLAFSSRGVIASGGFRNVKLWRANEVVISEPESGKLTAKALPELPEPTKAAVANLKMIVVSLDQKFIAAAPEAGTPIKVISFKDGKVIGEISKDLTGTSEIERLRRETVIAARLKTHYSKLAPAFEKQSKDEAEKAKKSATETAAAKRDVAVKKRTLAELELKKFPEAKPEEIEAAKSAVDEAERKVANGQRSQEISSRLAGEALAKQSAALAASAEAEALEAALKAEVEQLTKTAAAAKIVAGAFAFSKDSSRLIVADAKTNRMDVFAVQSLRHLDRIQMPKKVSALQTEKDGMVKAAISGDKTVKVTLPGTSWMMAKKMGDVEKPDVFADRVTALAFSPAGDLLATGGGVPSRSGSVAIWDMATADQLQRNDEIHRDAVLSVDFSPNGQLLATSSADKLVFGLEVSSLEKKYTFEGHTSHVLDVDWSSDALLLATAGADLQAKVWTIDTGLQKQKLEGYSKEVTAVSYKGGTDELLVASGDGSIKLGSAALPGAKGFLHSASFSEDGTIIVAGGEDGVVRVWDAKTKKLVHEFAN